MLDNSCKPIRKDVSTLILGLILISFSITGCSTKSTPVYQLTTSSIPAEAGSVNPASGEYKNGEEVQIQATANENWMFDGWEGDQGGSQNPVTITMSEDKTVNARFVVREYPLTVTTDGAGTVSETVVQAKTTDYEYSTVVELEASASTGWNFFEWQGDLQGTQNPQTITMDGEKTVTAVFDAIDYNVDVTVQGPGSVSITPQKQAYHYGDMVTFEAIPNGDNEFLGWFGTFEEFEFVYEHEIKGDVDVTAFFSSVEDAFLAETFEINVSEGTVDQARFNITNFLLDEILLTKFTVYDETHTEVSEFVFSSPVVLPARTLLELTVTFDFDTTDLETFKQWTFGWMFNYAGDSYVVEQEVGEPTSGSKRKSLKTATPVSVNIKR